MRRADVLGGGVTRRGLDAAMRERRLIAPVRGVIALPSLSGPGLVAASARARPTCVTAIAERGLPVIGRSRIVHVAIATRGRPPVPRDGLRLHYSERCGRSLAAMPTRVALDHAGRCVEPRAQLVMLDAALRAGRVKGTDLAAWTATPAARRDWLLARADARAESAQETLARIDLVEAGLRVVPQVYLDGVGRADLLVEGRLALEVDGRGFHAGDDAFIRDRLRDRVAMRGGFLVARITAGEVEHARVGEVAEIVAGILEAHPRPGRRTRMSD